jgi:hypothetical protein
MAQNTKCPTLSNPIFNVFLHHIVESDDDRALHDHTWISPSVILDGSYVEITRAGARLWPTGAIIFRWAKHAHRLVIKAHDLSSSDALTIFITGPTIRQWGFLCPQGWRWAAMVGIRNSLHCCRMVAASRATTTLCVFTASPSSLSSPS